MELLAVSAIIAILIAAAVVALNSPSKSVSLHGATVQIKSALSLARQYAITHRQAVYVLFPRYQNDVPASGDTSRSRGYRAYALCTVSNNIPTYLSDWQFLPPGLIIQTNSDIFADANFSTNMPAGGLGLSNPNNLPVVLFKMDGSVQPGSSGPYLHIYIGEGYINSSGNPILKGNSRTNAVQINVQTGTVQVE